ncbi:hypothetical protein C2S52_007303 [Perilla frutescens var. hirtella]|nr:hypothetical protein C2S52_007303 [Perilla frutescens var. hirtella]
MYFTGPTLFITLVYVDRVVLGYRRVTRSIPAIVEWKDMVLLRRQNISILDGGFGHGYYDGPCKDEDVMGVVVGDMHHENEANNNVDEGVPPIINGVELDNAGAGNVQVEVPNFFQDIHVYAC